MTARDFDPVFSTALRHELEHLAEAAGREPAPRPALRRPQVWVTLVTAAVLAAATVGVLRVVQLPVVPAAPPPAVVSPLSQITDPEDRASYVARAVRVLLDARGIGPGSRRVEVPADVQEAQVYLGCSPSSPFTVEIDGGGGASSTCAARLGGSFSGAQKPGAHRVAVTVPKGVAWALTIIAKPPPTVSAGALVDPLTQVRDRRNPDALVGDPRPLLRLQGSGDSRPLRFTVPPGVGRVRVYLPCRPTSAATAAVVDGRRISGCQNAIAHWFDLTPSASTVTASVTAPAGVAWSLLVVPAPPGAKDSPPSAPLRYPASGGDGPVIARARGIGAQATGTYTRRSDGIGVRIVCRGTGWIEFSSPDGDTSTRGDACGAPTNTGFGGGVGTAPKRLRWTVTPHGDVSWAVVITDSGTGG